jgi:hypothetical protein
MPAQSTFPQSQLNPLGLLAAASSNLLARDPSARNEDRDAESSFLEQWFTRTAVDPSVHVGDDPLSKSILTEEECDDIFEHFFTCLNVFALLLDPVLHARKRLQRRSPILFTCICNAVLSSASFATMGKISRDKTERVAALVDDYMGKVFSAGWKGVEVCQSLLLVVFWTKTSKAFEQDPCWLMFGVVSYIFREAPLPFSHHHLCRRYGWRLSSTWIDLSRKSRPRNLENRSELSGSVRFGTGSVFG